MKPVKKIKTCFNNRRKSIKQHRQLGNFYNRFRNGIHEVKSSIDGKAELKDAKAWLSSL
jgi:hypothetical protein